MLPAGKELRRLREELGLSMRDVESYTAKISHRHRNEEFSIPPSRLADIETKGILPSCYRLYSLSVIYGLPLTLIMSEYGVPQPSEISHNVPRPRASISEPVRTPAGKELRRIREHAGLTMRDVDKVSAKIAMDYRNEEFSIPPSRLSDIETKGVLPSIYRIYTLSVIYKIDIADLLRLYGVDTAQVDHDRALLGLSTAELEVTFSPELTPAQVTLTLKALANYYRACGGVGFQIDFELEELLIHEPEYA